MDPDGNWLRQGSASSPRMGMFGVPMPSPLGGGGRVPPGDAIEQRRVTGRLEGLSRPLQVLCAIGRGFGERSGGAGRAGAAQGHAMRMPISRENSISCVLGPA